MLCHFMSLFQTGDKEEVILNSVLMSVMGGVEMAPPPGGHLDRSSPHGITPELVVTLDFFHVSLNLSLIL